MPLRLDKVIIFCADVELLVKFYTDHFGFSVSGLPDPAWTVLNAGPVQIAFHKIGENFLPSSGDEFHVGDTNVKFVFQIDSDLAAFRQTLLEEKVNMGDIKQFPRFSYRSCDGSDPEGNVFQVIQNL